MEFQTFERKCSPRGETSTLRAPLAVLAIVATALVAGASIGGTHADGASASVRSIPTPWTRLSDVQPASASPFTAEWDGSPDWGIERTDDPRECDIERGISVACIFMD